MKTQVEVEALQEQLRVRKEKQYQLLEKLQAQEEAKRQAEDQVIGRYLYVIVDDIDIDINIMLMIFMLMMIMIMMMTINIMLMINDS